MYGSSLPSNVVHTNSVEWESNGTKTHIGAIAVAGTRATAVGGPSDWVSDWLTKALLVASYLVTIISIRPLGDLKPDYQTHL